MATGCCGLPRALALGSCSCRATAEAAKGKATVKAHPRPLHNAHPWGGPRGDGQLAWVHPRRLVPGPGPRGLAEGLQETLACLPPPCQVTREVTGFGRRGHLRKESARQPAELLDLTHLPRQLKVRKGHCGGDTSSQSQPQAACHRACEEAAREGGRATGRDRDPHGCQAPPDPLLRGEHLHSQGCWGGGHMTRKTLCHLTMHHQRSRQ